MTNASEPEHIEREREYVADRRDAAKVDTPKEELVGLAFSGGGVRSATFNLGLLQALDRAGVFRYVDYLSTVSGGGFIGGSLTTLMSERARKGRGDEPAEFPFSAERPPPEQHHVNHIRDGGKYLASSLSDALRIPALLARGILLNLLALVPLVVPIALVMGLFTVDELRSVHPDGGHDGQRCGYGQETWLTAATKTSSIAHARLNGIADRVEARRLDLAAADAKEATAALQRFHKEVDVEERRLYQQLRVLGEERDEWFGVVNENLLRKWTADADDMNAAIDALAEHEIQSMKLLREPDDIRAIAVVDFVDRVVADMGDVEYEEEEEAETAAPPVVLSSPTGGAFAGLAKGGIAVFVGWLMFFPLLTFAWRLLYRRKVRARMERREAKEKRFHPMYWRDLYERSFVLALVVAVVCVLLELQPTIVQKFHFWQPRTLFTAGVGGAFLSTALGASSVVKRFARFGRTAIMCALGLLGPLLLYLALLFLYDHVVYGATGGLSPPADWQGNDMLNQVSILLTVAVAGGVALLLTRVLDVNSTSMHGFYRDRLSRTYLFGTTNDGDLRAEEDIRLVDICQKGSGAPYHLINVALNLTKSEHNLRGRNSDFFVFSKFAIGGERTGYCRPEQMETIFPFVHLGTAVAVSGAAASPNMGVYGSSASVLMALLNIRLGYWVPNPAVIRRLYEDGPPKLHERLYARMRAQPVGLFPLLAEAFGWLHERSKLVNLSDGGHLENTGAYELLRRGCTVVIAGIGEADPEMRFGGIATLIRYARIDLGVEIDIDLDPLRRGDDGFSKAHSASGKIRYPDGREGVLVVIQAACTGDEDPVVEEYAARNPSFPHESTADQFFTEDQFEAYRWLGAHAGAEVFGDDSVDSFAALKDKVAEF